MVGLPIWCCEDRRAPFVEVFRRSALAHGHDLRLIAPASCPPADFVRLTATYRHLSPNSPAFELAVFRRYFEIRDRLAEAGAPAAARFVMADSDVVLLAPAAAFPEAIRSASLAGSIGVTGGIAETDISPHFSVWSRDAMADFCDFMVSSYASGADDLASLHAARLAAHEAHVSISDMTLMARWIARDRRPFSDTNHVADGHYIDHNITMAGCANAVFRMAFDRKALVLGDAAQGGGVVLTTREGATVRPLILHLVGRTKLLARAIEQRRRGALAARSLALAAGRRVRRLIR